MTTGMTSSTGSEELNKLAMLYFINTCFLCCITQSRKMVLTIESHTIPAYWNIRDGHKHQIYYRNLSPTHITSKGTYIDSNKHAVEIT